MATAPNSPDQNLLFGYRIFLAAIVVAVTYFAWGFLWGFPASIDSLAALFRHSASRTPAHHFGHVWQWVVAASATLFIAGLLSSSRHLRVLAITWFGSVAILAAAATVAFRATEPDSKPLLFVAVAAAFVFWIHVFPPRAA